MIVLEIIAGISVWSLVCFALGYLAGAQPRSKKQ